VLVVSSSGRVGFEEGFVAGVEVVLVLGDVVLVLNYYRLMSSVLLHLLQFMTFILLESRNRTLRRVVVRTRTHRQVQHLLLGH